MSIGALPQTEVMTQPNETQTSSGTVYKDEDDEELHVALMAACDGESGEEASLYADYRPAKEREL